MPDLPRIQALIKALRSPMPPKFMWKFETVLDRHLSCGTAGCALGLAEVMWGRKVISFIEPFGMDSTTADYIFYNCRPADDQPPFYGCCSSNVTPEMVAKALEDYLACHKEPSHGE